jgi:sulfatase maturation enzyme AslB (radical SAM superfamily)
MKNNKKYNTKAINLINNALLVKYQPFLKCNYKCSYCCERHKDESFDKLKIYQSAKKIKEKIIKKIDKDIMLSIIGGEVSLLDIEEFINNVLETLKDEKIKYIYIVSNFSKPAEYYNKINDWCKKNNIIFLLEASFHEEFTSEKDFFNKVKKLNFELLQIQTVVTEKNSEFMKKIKERHPEVFFEPNIYNDISKIDFPFSKLEILRYSQREKNYFFQKKCLQREINIKPNGDVYGNCKILKYGNINGNVFVPKKEFSITCKKETCNCVSTKIVELV